MPSGPLMPRHLLSSKRANASFPLKGSTMPHSPGVEVIYLLIISSEFHRSQSSEDRGMSWSKTTIKGSLAPHLTSLQWFVLQTFILFTVWECEKQGSLDLFTPFFNLITHNEQSSQILLSYHKKSDYGQANAYFCLVHVFSFSYVTDIHCLIAVQ